MKNNIFSNALALMLGLLCTGTILASSLKVYNMHDRTIIGMTNPIAHLMKGRDDEVIFPYVSIFKTNAVTFTLLNYGIQEFIWRGIIGPRYTAVVNLQENEKAKIEILENGAYKFKGKKYIAHTRHPDF